MNQYNQNGQQQQHQFGENGSGQQHQMGNGSYNTEQNWHHRQHGQFSDEEHTTMGQHNPKMENSQDKKHYVENVGSQFASGFLYGGQVGQFDPKIIAGCLDQEDMADRTFYQADMEMKRAFEEKNAEIGIKALEDMMKFVAMMLRETTQDANGEEHKVCEALNVKKENFK